MSFMSKAAKSSSSSSSTAPKSFRYITVTAEDPAVLVDARELPGTPHSLEEKIEAVPRSIAHTPSSFVGTLHNVKYTKEELKMARGFLFPAGREFQFNLGGTNAITTGTGGSAGDINQLIGVVGFASATEYTSLGTLFDEVFCTLVEYTYFPYNLNLTALPYVPQTTASLFSEGICTLDLHHNATGYSDVKSALSNATCTQHHSAKEFKTVWKNIEKKSGPNIQKTTSGTPTQGWANTNATDVAQYMGTKQFIMNDVLNQSGTALSGVTIGRVHIRYKLYFRNRA